MHNTLIIQLNTLAKKTTKKKFAKSRLNIKCHLTDGIFETGAYGVPSKSQNPTVLGQGGASSTLYSQIDMYARLFPAKFVA